MTLPGVRPLALPVGPLTVAGPLGRELLAWARGAPAGVFPQGGLDLLRQHGYFLTGLQGPTGENLQALLRLVGRASLPLGRVYEGHVNALALISAYGTPAQREQAARDAGAGHLFGVWNTEGPDGVRLMGEAGAWTLTGAKTFASGGRHVSRPLLPVDAAGGRQLVLLRADDAHSRVREVPDSWQPLGMAATVSVKLDFSGTRLQDTDLIGDVGDYYRQPMFGAGALRFCAVQLGGADAVLGESRRYLQGLGRAEDDVQLLRFADAWLGIHTAGLCVQEGVRLQDQGAPEARLLAQVDAARLATENACLAAMEACERAVGARGLLEPEPFPALIRDLRMYLRQPAPDAARLRLGRWVMGGGEA